MAADSHSKNDRKAGSHSVGARLINAGIITALLVLLFIVLLPMLWMIVTAFKTKGTAFQLAFLPETRLVDPPRGSTPLPIRVVDKEAVSVYLEWVDENAISVQATLTQGAKTETIDLQRGSAGTFSAVAAPEGFVAGEPMTVVYTLDETKNQDPITMTAVAGLNVTVKQPRLLAVNEGGKLRISLGGIPAEQKAAVLLVDENERERRVTLTNSGEGYFTGEVPAGAETALRVERERAFGAAVAARYTLDNFRSILGADNFNFGKFFFNSLVVATSAGLLTVLICTLAGYAFAQFNFHFRDSLFGLLLTSMLVPGMIFMVPQFSITLSLGMMDSYAGMVVPHLANVFGLFLMRQYISQIPRDLFAAAEIDGARQHQIFHTIVIPICLPIMVTLFLLVFVGQWSNFLWQLIINTGQSEVLTLPVGLQQFKGQNANEWEKIMAGACFSIVPIAVLFLTLQKYFMEGLTAGAVKE
ncbi:ABC transporter permease subunit [bacterium]|nr:ABC transporter permease subunit [bacterium]